jgi:hypothetical protein
MDLKVSPAAEDAPEAKAPLLDLEAVERRVRTLETTPDEPTLQHLATREPTSFHQTTIYYGLVRPNTPPWRKHGLLATSIGIVFLQCFVAIGLAHGVTFSTCSEHSDCSRGTFCEGGMCEWCYGPLRPCCQTNSTDTCVLDEKQTTEEAGFSDELREEKNREAMCAACTTSKGFETLQDVVKGRMDSMMLQDWLTLFLASLVVAFAVFAEIRDCMLCEIALREVSKRREVPRGWRYAINGLNYARYIFLLPNIIYSVMALVYEDGGRVKYLCLNTVAVLFLLEVDNLAFLHGLGERTRMEAEQHAHSGARVTEDDLRIMGVVKLVCVVLIPCSVLVGVCGHSWVPDEPDTFIIAFPPLPSIAVLFVQRVMASRRKLKGACGGLGWAILNYSMYGVWGGLFYTVTYIQAQGPQVVLSWGPLPYVLAAMLALTLVMSILTDSPPSPSTASSGSS